MSDISKIVNKYSGKVTWYRGISRSRAQIQLNNQNTIYNLYSHSWTIRRGDNIVLTGFPTTNGTIDCYAYMNKTLNIWDHYYVTGGIIIYIILFIMSLFFIPFAYISIGWLFQFIPSIIDWTLQFMPGFIVTEIQYIYDYINFITPDKVIGIKLPKLEFDYLYLIPYGILALLSYFMLLSYLSAIRDQKIIRECVKKL